MTENQSCPVQKYQQQDQIEEKKNNHESVLSILLNVPAHTKTKQKKPKRKTQNFSLFSIFFLNQNPTLKFYGKSQNKLKNARKKIQSIAQSIFEI